MLTSLLRKLKSKWTIAVLTGSVLCSAGSAQAECADWPEPADSVETTLLETSLEQGLSGHWEVEYDLTGSEFETRNTPLGAADTTHVVGPGTMTIRFESDSFGAGGSILEGGDAQIVQLDLTQQFTLRTRVLGFRAHVTTQMQSAIPDNRWNGNQAGQVSLGSSRGTINGDVLTVAAPGMRGYHTLGSLLCEGSGCRFGRMPAGVESRIDDDLGVIALRALYFMPGGPAVGAGFASNEIALPLSARADPYLRLLGREIHRIFVPPAGTRTAMAAQPCYSVLDLEARTAETFGEQ